MGRRKIEIRPIKDDRNRSVTFLKRKGGLFKKAYELGVLCQVDVAVIIFGHNKKLYEFCSGDINDTIGRFQYYAGAHEHKGPADFMGKGGDDDDDEDGDMGSPTALSHSPPEPAAMQHNLHNQPGLQHMHHSTPLDSPPMRNGSLSTHQRGSTPQPGSMSRPDSRNSMSRRPSNLGAAPYVPPQAQMTQPYGYAPGQQYYANPQAAAAVPRSTPQPVHTQAPHSQNTYPGPTQPQLQQAYMEDQRRQSMPPTIPPHVQQAPQARPSPQPPQPQSESLSRKQSPQQDQGAFQSPPLPQPKTLPNYAKSHSIFTPIDDSRSLLAQHWGAPAPNEMMKHQYGPQSDASRLRTIDASTLGAENAKHGHAQSDGPRSNTGHNTHPPMGPMRTGSNSSIPTTGPPSRSNTMQSDAKRPRLKVQIPSEQSDAGEATADSTEQDTATTIGQIQGNKVLLPPPSPSTNNPLLSAGASGPPNPFARPAPPASHNLSREQIETPLSALPSRVMDGNMLPSPSDLWQTMFSRSTNDNMMPSPLNFQPTPIHPSGPSFRDDSSERKRAADDLALADSKRIRT